MLWLEFWKTCTFLVWRSRFQIFPRHIPVLFSDLGNFYQVFTEKCKERNQKKKATKDVCACLPQTLSKRISHCQMHARWPQWNKGSCHRVAMPGSVCVGRSLIVTVTTAWWPLRPLLFQPRDLKTDSNYIIPEESYGQWTECPQKKQASRWWNVTGRKEDWSSISYSQSYHCTLTLFVPLCSEGQTHILINKGRNDTPLEAFWSPSDCQARWTVAIIISFRWKKNFSHEVLFLRCYSIRGNWILSKISAWEVPSWFFGSVNSRLCWWWTLDGHLIISFQGQRKSFGNPAQPFTFNSPTAGDFVQDFCTGASTLPPISEDASNELSNGSFFWRKHVH